MRAEEVHRLAGSAIRTLFGTAHLPWSRSGVRGGVRTSEASSGSSAFLTLRTSAFGVMASTTSAIARMRASKQIAPPDSPRGYRYRHAPFPEVQRNGEPHSRQEGSLGAEVRSGASARCPYLLPNAPRPADVRADAPLPIVRHREHKWLDLCYVWVGRPVACLYARSRRTSCAFSRTSRLLRPQGLRPLWYLKSIQCVRGLECRKVSQSIGR